MLWYTSWHEIYIMFSLFLKVCVCYRILLQPNTDVPWSNKPSNHQTGLGKCFVCVTHVGKVSVFVTASTVLVPAGCPCQKPWVVVFLDATSLIIFSDFGQSHLYLILPTHILLKLTFCVAVSWKRWFVKLCFMVSLYKLSSDFVKLL